MEKQKNLAAEGAVLGVKDNLADGKQRVMAADGGVYFADGTDAPAADVPKGTDLAGIAGIVAAAGGAASGILGAISMITNKHTVEEHYNKTDADINVNGSQSLDVNSKKWIGVAAASAAVIVVALVLIFRNKH